MPKEIRSRRRPGDNDAASTESPARNETSPEPATPEVSDEIASSIETDSEPLTVEQAKLVHMRILQIRGMTQAEIGKFFGVSSRTIRNWIKRAIELKIGLDIKMKPDAAVAEMLLGFAADEAELVDWKRQAEKAGDNRLALNFAKERRKLRSERFKLLRSLGLCAGYSLPTIDAEDGADANPFISLFGDLFAPQGPDEEDQHDHSS